MICLYEGLPGSGKSHYMVKNVVCPALIAGRKVWAVMDLKAPEVYQKVLGLPASAAHLLSIEKDLSFIPKVSIGDVVVIDECQAFFRAGGTPDKEVLLWLETHRHLGVDVALASQDYTKIFRQVYVLCELVFKFRKLSFLGLHKTTRLTVKGGVKETDVIRKETINFDPLYYQLYNSYFAAGAKEVKGNSGSIWRSWPVRIAFASVVGLVYMVGFRPWLGSSSARGLDTKKAPSVEIPAGVSTPRADHPSPVPGAATAPNFSSASSARPSCIIGSLGLPDGRDWFFLLADGRRLSLAQMKIKFSPSVWHSDPVLGWRFESDSVSYSGAGCTPPEVSSYGGS